MPHRLAIYYAPPSSGELWQRASRWLGRDPATGSTSVESIAGLAAEQRAALSLSARRYGFHATLKAPMRLAEGRSMADFDAALSDFAARRAPVAIGRLQLSLLDGFLALTPVEQTDALTGFVGEVVDGFEPWRAPLSQADRARRLQSGLTPRQSQLLERFGYPYVMEEFRFHMTLTDRLPAERRDEMLAAASEWFEPVLEDPFSLDRLVLYSEPAAGADFQRDGDYLLTGNQHD